MNSFGKLLLSIFLDAVGMLPTLAGILGAATGVLAWLVPIAELIDILWAPVAALLAYYLYGRYFFAGLVFVEEILPFTDFFPTFTFAWLYEKLSNRKSVSEALAYCKSKFGPGEDRNACIRRISR